MRSAVLTLFVLLTYAVGAQTPVRLGPEVNTEYHEINPILSADGKTLYFVRVNHPDNTYGRTDSEDIWYSTRRSDGTWTEAQRIPELNIGRYNAVLGVSYDGQTLLINGVYNRQGNAWKKRGLSTSTWDGDRWSKPIRLKMKKFSRKNRGLQSSASLSVNGEYIFLSFSRSFNGHDSDLYYSERKRNGRWSSPTRLKGVNSGASEEAPSLAPDNNTLYFSSDRKKKGHFDVYMSTATGGLKKWSKPVALSDSVNSPAWESYFKFDFSSTLALYSSTYGSPGNADIFMWESAGPSIIHEDINPETLQEERKEGEVSQ